ncbi:MAG: hypothetical protein FWC01_03305 [Treponema sp.]|nr:hypothetical protein [Treponema sp.]MCL2237050.1 hypothetical protein [Treponema sp.]
MEPKWYAIFARYDDSNIYLDDDKYRDYYCQNPKCNRLLTPFPEQNKLSSIKKLKKGFILLSSMNILLCSDSILNIISSYTKEDVYYKALNPNVSILQITSTCTINNELIDESPICSNCGITLSRTYGRAFTNDKIKIFKYPDNEKSLICRTKIPMRDSSRASYDLYANEKLINELKKTKCFDILECIT